MNDNIIDVFLNFDYLDLFLFYRNNLFAELINLFDFSVNDFDWDHLFYDSVDGDLNFDRYNDVTIDFNNFRLFDNVSDNLLYLKSSGDLSVLNHNSFRNHFLDFSIFLVNLISN